jgi:zinc protease
MTREQLYDYYRTHYVPGNVVVAVAGDFDGDGMLEKVDRLFGAIPPGRAQSGSITLEPPQRGERRVNIEGPGTTSYIEISFRAPRATDDDFYPMVVLETILGGAKGMSLWGGGGSNRSSRLYRALVETELASGVDCGMSSTVDPYLFSFSATVRGGRTLPEVEAALLAEIERAMRQPVEQAELEKAIKQTRAQFAYSSESVTDQGHWLGFSEVVATTEWFENFLQRLAAVTAEDVQRVAGAYLRPSLRNVGWYLPQGDN